MAQGYLLDSLTERLAHPLDCDSMKAGTGPGRADLPVPSVEATSSLPPLPLPWFQLHRLTWVVVPGSSPVLLPPQSQLAQPPVSAPASPAPRFYSWSPSLI